MVNISSEITPARPDEWTAALTLALQQVPDTDRPTRLANAQALLAAGDIDPNGIFVARDAGTLVGVQLSIPLPGGGGLFWLPQVLSSWQQSDLAGRLVRHALAWLQQRGVKVAQALVHSADLPGAEPLLHGGFRHITQLHYFCHDLHNIPSPAAAAGLLFEAYAPANASAFQETLLRTYEDTLDCPELNGLRTIDEILVGHQAQGIWRPETWWLVFADGVPAGILMLTELFERDGWELTYVGIAKEHRSRGLGRKLIVRALREMHEREAPRLVVAVDRRNTPALRLYEGLGFAQTGSREVFLCTIGRPWVYARDVKDA